MDSIIRFRTAQKFVLPCFSLLLVFAFSSCSSKEDEKSDKSKNDSVKAEGTLSPQQSPAKQEAAPQAQEDSATRKEELNKSKEDISNRQQVRKAYAREVIKLLQGQEKTHEPKRYKEEFQENEQEKIDRTFTALNSIADSERKIGIIETLSDVCHGSVVKIVDKALDDDDPEVRRAAMELLVDYESPDVLPVVAKALRDEDEQTREAAVDTLAFVDDPKVAELLVKALSDSSESVRMAALEAVEEQKESIKLDVFEAAISSPYKEVKEQTVSMLTDLANHDAMDILILGLRDSDAEFREEVNLALEFLISREFNSYEEAKNWWDENRGKYDDELFEKDD